ncbi:AMP-dependent synthetase/ligase [Labedaea rhizosphaerae]|uniref:Acyl-CoA synthetase n=1 Tax=Labedaea rhizosphaerae TaxID=598644 RepID=A0A4R6SGD3_LABRH|nr:long-chain fatty acid--CoA ligase [Labedaea rhizosphaerae]TDQ01082.1 long-subunit acyl-CoA synthetase (AMP-forming) [Labedaea rhizosphaerae]
MTSDVRVDAAPDPTDPAAPAPATLCAAFQATAARYAHQTAVRTPDDSLSLTWGEYADRVRHIAGGLAGLGVGPGDTVALMMVNRPEFHLADTATLHLGATPFSVYNTSAPEQIKYLFGNAGNRVVITEKQFLPKLRGLDLDHVLCVDDGPGLGGLAEPADFDFEASWRAVEADDVATIIYTSGTTGPPKGVELTHANLVAQCTATAKIFPPSGSDSGISYLPSAHIADRWASHYSPMLYGGEITCVDDHRKVLGVLTSVHPTMFGGVPQMWYKLKAGIEAMIAHEQDPAKQQAMQWAIDTGRKYVRAGQEGTVPDELAAEYAKADELVLSKIRAKLGLDRVRNSCSGAAPIAPEVLEFVCGLGLPVLELWGMSELSCCATINPPGGIKIGTVGTPITGVEVRLADDGELLVRGPTVMKGYRNDPERTKETIDADGWLRTGDVATIDEDGYVTIIDRKKELIINSFGKNMSPAAIENAIRAASPLIGQAVVIGDDRPYNVALLVLDPDMAANFARQYGLPDPSVEAVSVHPGLIGAIEAAIDEANSHLSRVEQIKRFTVLPTVWEPGGAELTPTVKLRRRPIADKYKEQIEQLYA